MRLRYAVALAVALPVTGLAAPANKPELVDSFSDWHVYKTGTGTNRLCYALSQPKKMEPSNVKHGEVFFLISTWPGRKVRNEPSVTAGYEYMAGSKVQLQVGKDNFDFFTKNEGADGGAWAEQPADEMRLIEAMKRGANLIVSGTSTRGTLTKDTYSLSGISAALDAIASDCK